MEEKSMRIKVKKDTNKSRLIGYIIIALSKEEELELTALGGAIPTLCSVIEFLHKTLGINYKLNLFRSNGCIGLKARLRK